MMISDLAVKGGVWESYPFGDSLFTPLERFSSEKKTLRWT